MARFGFEVLAERIGAHGSDVVFGLPGTQNIHLFEGLRRCGLRTVVPSNEFAAGMMAAGWARTRGRTGVLATIPGPGFALALGALAEADHDSIPMVFVTGTPATGPGDRFQFQRLAQGEMARGLVRASLQVTTLDELPGRVDEAFAAAVAGEPGPVLLEVATGALREKGEAPSRAPTAPAGPPVAPEGPVLERLERAERPVIVAGAGTFACADALRRLAASLGAPVVTTPGARGVVPESAPLAMGFEPMRTDTGHLQALVDRADLVLILGAKLAHNATAGFALHLAEETLVHVDASPVVLNANYPASLAVHGDVPALVEALAAAEPGPSAWSGNDVATWRTRLRTRDRSDEVFEPDLPEGIAGWGDLFATLQGALGPDGIVATDSGQHQFLARRHVQVEAPRGLLLPSDFQSMGFGIPAAIGAAIAAPDRRVAAVVGDGGFLMTCPELAVAAREGVRLVVVVLTDGHYGLIRAQQVSAYARSHGTALPPVDVGGVAASLGAGYARLGPGAAESVEAAVQDPGVTVLEVPLSDSTAFTAHRARTRLRESVYPVAGPAVRGVRALLRRLRGG
jgi:acetolactate synthase-1/2/3 large subunit